MRCALCTQDLQAAHSCASSQPVIRHTPEVPRPSWIQHSKRLTARFCTTFLECCTWKRGHVHYVHYVLPRTRSPAVRLDVFMDWGIGAFNEKMFWVEKEEASSGNEKKQKGCTTCHLASKSKSLGLQSVLISKSQNKTAPQISAAQCWVKTSLPIWKAFKPLPSAGSHRLNQRPGNGPHKSQPR